MGWNTSSRTFAAVATIFIASGLAPTGKAQEVPTPCVDAAQFARSVASISWYYDQIRTEPDGTKTVGERATGWFFRSPRYLVTAAHFARDLPTDAWQEVELRQAADEGSRDRTIRVKVRVHRQFEPRQKDRLHSEPTGPGDMAVLELLGELPEVQPLEIRMEPPSPNEHVLVVAYPAGDMRAALGVVRTAEAPSGRFAGLSLLEVQGSNRLLLNGGASGAPVLDCSKGRVTAVITGLLTGTRLSFLPPGTVVPTPWGSPTNAAVPARVLATLQEPNIPAAMAPGARPGPLASDGLGQPTPD
jgi:hypothetical protein